MLERIPTSVPGVEFKVDSSGFRHPRAVAGQLLNLVRAKFGRSEVTDTEPYFEGLQETATEGQTSLEVRTNVFSQLSGSLDMLMLLQKEQGLDSEEVIDARDQAYSAIHRFADVYGIAVHDDTSRLKLASGIDVWLQRDINPLKLAGTVEPAQLMFFAPETQDDEVLPAQKAFLRTRDMNEQNYGYVTTEAALEATPTQDAANQSQVSSVDAPAQEHIRKIRTPRQWLRARRAARQLMAWDMSELATNEDIHVPVDDLPPISDGVTANGMSDTIPQGEGVTVVTHLNKRRIAFTGAAILAGVGLFAALTLTGEESSSASANTVRTTTTSAAPTTTIAKRSNAFPKALGAQVSHPRQQADGPTQSGEVGVGEAQSTLRFVVDTNLYNAVQNSVAGESGRRADKDPLVTQFTNEILRIIASEKHVSYADLDEVEVGQEFTVNLSAPMQEQAVRIANNYGLGSV